MTPENAELIEILRYIVANVDSFPGILLLAYLLKKYVINGSMERYFSSVERREAFQADLLKKVDETLTAIRQANNPPQEAEEDVRNIYNFAPEPRN